MHVAEFADHVSMADDDAVGADVTVPAERGRLLDGHPRGHIERQHAVTITPRGRGRYYYLASLEMETLALTDLEELEGWLRGELSPAVGGQGSLLGAIGNGAKRLFIRVLGLPARRMEVRSPAFRVR